ncbi:MAG: 2-phosphosulfolactate phosphatase [Bacteroidetes bacterium]|jgi:2-phosphosulfolactate phosphatase|nr:2-phosphosulfolactate phosphatase [Bacteroidota bacterium]
MATAKPVVEVCLTPALFYQYDVSQSIVVVIDILRATSSICVAFQYGAHSIVPVTTTEESLAYREKGFLVGAERQGSMVEGFDFGNSPFSYMDDKIRGRDIALTTTNGTRAMHLARSAAMVVAGSFLNLQTLADWLIKQNQNVLCLCAGWKDTFNLEDAIFAGALAEKLLPHFELTPHRDSALAAMRLYNIARNDMYEFLAQSSHRTRLERLKVDEDVIYCLTPDQTQVVPVLRNGVLYNHRDL